jgi:hypothetical protein
MKFSALLVIGVLVGSGICSRADEIKPSQQRPDVAIVAQKVVLYEEDPRDPYGKQSVGSVIWRTEAISPGKRPELAVRADVEIPERKISVTWTLRRDTDPNRSTSHTIEIMFKLPPNFPSGGIFNVPGIWMKQAEQTQGTALAVLSVRVTTGYFLIGLSNAPADRERNIQLLQGSPWFDIPIVYTNNQRAILAMEKGSSGEAPSWMHLPRGEARFRPGPRFRLRRPRNQKRVRQP